MPPSVGDRQQLAGSDRRQREGDGRRARVDRLLQRPDPSRAADERHPRIGTDVRHTEHRRENAVLENRHVQPRGRIPGGGRLRLRQVDAEPASRQVHRQPPPGRDPRTVGHDRKAFAQRGQILLRGPIRQVRHRPVVGQDARLPVGKRHAEKEPRGVRRIVAGQLVARPGRAGDPMVPVGDVHGGDSGESRDRGARRLGGQPPHAVAHAVRRRDIEERGPPGRAAVDHAIERRGRAVGQEHDAGLRPQRHHVPGPVVLLVAPGPLVALDDAAVVLVQREAAGKTGLLVFARLHPVEVEGGLRIDDQRRPLGERLQVAGRPRVDPRAVRVGAVRQIDLGTRHAEKAQRIVRRQIPRFAGGHDVVGDGGHRGGRGRRRAECAERTQDGQGRLSATGRRRNRRDGAGPGSRVAQAPRSGVRGTRRDAPRVPGRRAADCGAR